MSKALSELDNGALLTVVLDYLEIAVVETSHENWPICKKAIDSIEVLLDRQSFQNIKNEVV